MIPRARMPSLASSRRSFPRIRLYRLKPHLEWAESIDPQRWLQKPGSRPDLYEKEMRYRKELLGQLAWLRHLLESREDLLWYREMLSEPIQAVGGIRATELMERWYAGALEAKRITSEDLDAFRPLATRLRWALGVIANSKSKVRVKYLAVLRGEDHPPYGVVSQRVIRDPVDGDIADVVWELDPLDNIPVKIGLEIPIQATLTHADGTPVGRGKHTYGGTRTGVGWRARNDPGATLRFHWNVSRDYRAVLTPAGADSAGATATVEPQKQE